MPHTHVQIINNHAKRGSGIYIEDQNAGAIDSGFFQVFDLQYQCSDIDSVITLENNTADEAGSAVYGGQIDHCHLYTRSQPIFYEVSSGAIFSNLFKILDLPSLVSQVSLNPFALHVAMQQ